MNAAKKIKKWWANNLLKCSEAALHYVLSMAEQEVRQK
jgi:hypothetical protein